MHASTVISAAARTLASSRPACESLEDNRDVRAALSLGSSRGYIRPPEEELLRNWFARFLTLRSALWEIIADLEDELEPSIQEIENREQWRIFVLGYSAACLIVRLDTLLIEDIARTRVARRKLNEPVPELRIPRKQLTAVFRSLAHPRNALRILEAMRWAEANRGKLESMGDDAVVGFAARALADLETVLDPSHRHYGKRLVRYRRHSDSRRRGSALRKALFVLLETSGRTIAELRDRWSQKGVDRAIKQQVLELLRPGDVVITRHHKAFTNLFLPGYWPHAALYIGSEEDRIRLGVELDPDRRARWKGAVRFLEALKDGVRFRSPDETLAVDALAIIRPRLDIDEIAAGLARISQLEGKLYNFDFDFFHSDRLVCTEVVYRAFDGIGSMTIPLKERAGRPTLSAENLLDLGLEGALFEVVAIYGAETCRKELMEGESARSALELSYGPKA